MRTQLDFVNTLDCYRVKVERVTRSLKLEGEAVPTAVEEMGRDMAHSHQVLYRSALPHTQAEVEGDPQEAARVVEEDRVAVPLLLIRISKTWSTKK